MSFRPNGRRYTRIVTLQYRSERRMISCDVFLRHLSRLPIPPPQQTIHIIKSWNMYRAKGTGIEPVQCVLETLSPPWNMTLDSIHIIENLSDGVRARCVGGKVQKNLPKQSCFQLASVCGEVGKSQTRPFVRGDLSLKHGESCSAVRYHNESPPSLNILQVYYTTSIQSR